MFVLHKWRLSWDRCRMSQFRLFLCISIVFTMNSMLPPEVCRAAQLQCLALHASPASAQATPPAALLQLSFELLSPAKSHFRSVHLLFPFQKALPSRFFAQLAPSRPSGVSSMVTLPEWTSAIPRGPLTSIADLCWVPFRALTQCQCTRLF